MKTIIALCLIGFAIAAQSNPLATSYCMGIADGSANCTQCYNYGTGTIAPRYLSSNLCTGELTKITDCLWYANTKANDTRAATDCGQCNGKDWMNVAQGASAWTVACSAAIPTSGTTTACDANVTNCTQTYCLSATNGAAYVKGCRLCDATYHGNGGTTALGYESCLLSTGGGGAAEISGCSIYNPLNKLQCMVCASGKAVPTANDTSCVDFTADSNCRKTGGASNTYCNECKNGYYFNAQTCTIGYSTTTTTTGANIMAFSALFMALLAFFN